MKRYIWPLLVFLALVACSRKGPTPTSSLPLIVPDSPTPTSASTPTPGGSPVPRITIVPSATRFMQTTEEGFQDIGTSPPGTAEFPSSPDLSSTPTRRVIDTGTTTALRLTPTLPESPLATPSSPASGRTPSADATATRTPSVDATATSRPSADATATSRPSADATATHTPSADATATRTPTPGATSIPTTTPSPHPGGATFTPTPTVGTNPSSTPSPTATSAGEAWRLENVFTYHDTDLDEFYIWGEVVNNTNSYQRITSLLPVVKDGSGNPITSAQVDSLPGYDQLRQTVRLAPEQSLAFSFLVYLPIGLPFQGNYEIQVEMEPTEPAPVNLEIIGEQFYMLDWPYYFEVEGTFDNRGSDLTEYVVLLIAVYDDQQHLIGLGWFYETSSSYLTTGVHPFLIEVELHGVIDYLGLEMQDYEFQIFGR